MGLFTRLFKRSASTDAGSVGSDFLPTSFGGFGGGGYNDTGVTISEANALISSTVWGCVSLIAQTVSTLPLHVLDRDGGKLPDHPVHLLLTTQVNEYMTPAVFREVLLTQALLYGGAFAAVDRDERGVPIALYPLRSDRTRPVRQGGNLVYETRVGNSTHYLTPDRIVCLLGWTHDGITPVSPVQHGKQAIALSVAAERYAGKAFSGGNMGGILQTPPMNKDAMDAFVSSWRAKYTGIDNAFKVAVLPDPMKFTPTTLKPQEGQMVEARQAIVVDICRIWKVPPSMLGVLEKSSYSSLEQQNMAYFQMTILPWLVKLEQELMSKLLLEVEKATLEIRFNADALLRASTTERYTAYQTGRQGGWLSINDVRRKEGMPPIEGGDTYLTPLNMTPVGPQPSSAGGAALPAASGPDSPASRELLAATVKRFVTKESKALARSASKRSGDELGAWAKTFYADHRQLVTNTLTPALRAVGLKIDPEAAALRHCEQSLRVIESGLTNGLTTEELVEDVENRTAELVDDLLNGGSRHAA